MKFDYKAYERLFPRQEAEKIKAEVNKLLEPGNVLEEAEAKQDPVKETEPEPAGAEGGVIDEVE